MACDDNPPIDLSEPDFVTWIRLVFDHPLPDKGRKAWYWTLDREVRDPTVLLQHFANLCSSFDTSTSNFSASQIDQGIWFLLGAYAELPRLLIEPAVVWPVRQACIRSMAAVYAGYVANYPDDEPLENCFDIWFDLVNGGMALEPESLETTRVREELLRTLIEILAIKDDRCQHAALHGLGHLQHPRRAKIVDDWLARNRKRLPREAIEWVLECRDGTVM